MTTHKDAEKQTHDLTQEPHTMIGAGRLAAGLWKKRTDEIDFDFNVFRLDRNTGVVGQQFQSGDLADLARLVQLLAAEMATDEALGVETCDDLACLAASLEDVLPFGYVFPGIRCRKDGPAARSIASLLDNRREAEGQDFLVNASGGHVYRELVAIDVWMRGIGPTFGVVLPPITLEFIGHRGGGCPVCGANDGGLGLSDRFWFYCQKHQVRWRARGTHALHLLDEDPNDSEKNFNRIGSFQEVYPMLHPETLRENS